MIRRPKPGFQVRVLPNAITEQLVVAEVAVFEPGEARLAFGPGYRLYFGKAKDAVVLLLLGGDKGSQTKDIKQAKRYWASYEKETKHGKTK